MTKGIDASVISKRITQIREERGMNQAELAQKAGVTPAAVSQIESGKRTPTTPVLHRIANVLKVSIDYLTGRTNEDKFEDLLQQPEVQQFYRGFQSLDDEDKKTIQKHIEFLKGQQKKDKKV